MRKLNFVTRGDMNLVLWTIASVRPTGPQTRGFLGLVPDHEQILSHYANAHAPRLLIVVLPGSKPKMGKRRPNRQAIGPLTRGSKNPPATSVQAKSPICSKGQACCRYRATGGMKAVIDINTVRTLPMDEYNPVNNPGNRGPLYTDTRISFQHGRQQDSNQ